MTETTGEVSGGVIPHYRIQVAPGGSSMINISGEVCGGNIHTLSTIICCSHDRFYDAILQDLTPNLFGATSQ